MVNLNLKSNKGIIMSDAIVAILITIVFVGIISSLMYNIVLESVRVKISSQQISYITDIFQYAEKLSYTEVTADNLKDLINSKNSEYVSAGDTLDELATECKIAITVKKYNQTENNTDKLDLIKIITVKVQNEASGKEYIQEMSTLKKATISEVKEALGE